MIDPVPRIEAPAEEGRSASPVALSDLYARHWGELVRFVQAAFGSGPPEPEDVAQFAFGQYAALPDPGMVENPRAFLFRCAKNYVVDQKRRMLVRRTFAEGPDAERLGSGVCELDAERVLRAKQRLSVVESAIQTMTPRMREFFILNRMHDLSYAEIARRKRVSQTLVKKVVTKAVLRCQQALRDAGEDWP